jgi:hypothetical protein
LEFVAGDQLSLRRGVIVVGRSASCDVVLDDPAVSRRQLLLHVTADGVVLANVGRQAVSRNGAEIDDSTLAVDGDRIAIGGEPFAVLRRTTAPDVASRWILRLDGGLALKLRRTPFTVGGGSTDDLTVDGWPPAALSLHDVDTGIIVELGSGSEALLSAEERALFDEDGFARVAVGGGFVVGGRRFAITQGGAPLEGSTECGGEPRAEIRLEAYKRGGVLSLDRGGAVSEVFLAQRRFALVRALLAPPEPAAAGDLLPVDALCRRIWPKDPHKDESDFNVLLYRVRRDLLRAGIDASEVIERARGAGMVRAPIGERARIVVA